MVWAADSRTTTISAQAICALQAIVRTISAMKAQSMESPNLVFQHVPEDALKPEKLRLRLAELVSQQVGHLSNAGQRGRNDFGELNPFASAHMLSALAKGDSFVSPTCWTALFAIFWSLERKYPGYESRSGVAMPYSQPNAFVTSLCIDAIELVFATLSRRWTRLSSLTEAIKALEEHEQALAYKKTLAEDWFNHRCEFLHERVMELVSDAADDAAVNDLFAHWSSHILNGTGAKSIEGVFAAFKAAHKEIAKEHAKVKAQLDEYDREFEKTCEIVRDAADRVEKERANPLCADNEALKGLIDDRYRPTSEDVYKIPSAAKQLKQYWRDHADAAHRARVHCSDLRKFLCDVFDGYQEAAEAKSAADFCKKLDAIASGFRSQRESLREHTAAAIDWCHSVMNHQLSLARSDRLGEFDVAEMIHAARVVARSGRLADASVILEAIDVSCRVQYADGKWPCTQPFYWEASGLAAYPQSAEVGWALVSIMRRLTEAAEEFGIGQAQLLAALQRPNLSLERYLGWLNANVQSYRMPGLLKPGSSSWITGWSSDRTPEKGLVHTWATANALEFLVDYRHVLQEQINIVLRMHFNSYHANDLKSMATYNPPNLLRPYPERTGIALWRDLQLHRRRAEAQAYWRQPCRRAPQLWSVILAGPPGSAKSFLAKSIAGELRWPLISLSPADFLSAGEGGVEARARDIFDSLRAGSRLVFFFDEIDELILDRSTQQKQGAGARSVFTFLTPSFLTKLQDLREAAERKSFLFLIGTNYSDRIDAAAKRSGRIDQELIVVYPDEATRAELLVTRLEEALLGQAWPDTETKKARIEAFFGPSTPILALKKATCLMSVPGIFNLCDEIANAYCKKSDTEFLKWLEKETPRVAKGARREVDLGVYADRPGAAKEWAMMLDLLPDAAAQRNEMKKYIAHLRADDLRLESTQICESALDATAKWVGDPALTDHWRSLVADHLVKTSPRRCSRRRR